MGMFTISNRFRGKKTFARSFAACIVLELNQTVFLNESNQKIIHHVFSVKFRHSGEVYTNSHTEWFSPDQRCFILLSTSNLFSLCFKQRHEKIRHFKLFGAWLRGSGNDKSWMIFLKNVANFAIISFPYFLKTSKKLEQNWNWKEFEWKLEFSVFLKF